ncbi:polyphosphate kinase 2 [Gallaecimonas pentaromativorans]|uniref:ADP/GDP-polyphosphate phosphotransferase n=1 Tax=Gallaecimonas pentaromativorans TaxID=584787 RepID=A0A3N1PLD2_9GAMM|nr:polyphosphate kinase 2 [Gallaecimonas pentaromativorans]MED5524688.1 polyphosphate kinase 2 [Pseudomonadota bacterium]ROQ28678.1 polyphosphate kinase 2 [Gallaecimonas pentaromativorans]
MKKDKYLEALAPLQKELVALQQWIQDQGLRVVVVFEGRDAAGKGGIIKTITANLNPRHVKVAALGVPTEREEGQWYFQRYVAHLPAKGEMVLFDRSWYNRAGVEKVMGFCSEQQYEDFLSACPTFEKLLVDDGIVLIKYWLNVSPDEQQKRFQARLDSPLKRWKFSQMDLEGRERWQAYAHARDRMLKDTDSRHCPWFIVDANDKKKARLNCISHLLSQLPYRPAHYPQVTLGEVKGKELAPDKDCNWVPERY